jgi:hypothetical protein
MSTNRQDSIMLGFMKRGFTAGVLALFLVQATGCTTIRRDAQLTDVMRTQEPIVGVTTTTGQPIPFDGPGWIAGDTVYGPVKTQVGLEQADTAYRIPVEMVDSVWVRRAGLSTEAKVGIGVVAAAILIAMAVTIENVNRGLGTFGAE